jgi:hypothetical protein
MTKAEYLMMNGAARRSLIKVQVKRIILSQKNSVIKEYPAPL